MKSETFERIRIGELPVDCVDLEGALRVIEELIQSGNGGTVFTPNVDHVVQAEDNPRFRAAYAAASLSLVDGVPVLWASRLLGTPLPVKISGSDLVKPLMHRAAERGYRVYFLGGDEGVAEKARDVLLAEMPNLKIVGIDSARINVDAVSPELLARIREQKPDIVLVALGAPKQEIFSHEQLHALKPAVLIGVGASLDFVANVRARAPKWVSQAGLEWLFRLSLEPRRLAKRYLLRGPLFFGIVGRQFKNRRAH